MKPITASFIVPALNEEAVIVSTVQQAISVIESHFADYELLLIDDGSTDSTGRLMEALAREHPKIRVRRNARNLGLGVCYQIGVTMARFEYVMLFCGDGGMPSSSLHAIFEQIGRADIVIPFVRNLRRIKSPVRFVLSKAYTALLNTLFGLRLEYYNFQAIHRLDLLRRIDIQSDGFGFQGEILVKLLRAGCTYVEVGCDGAEKTGRSRAMRPRNLVSVCKTVAILLKGGTVGNRAALDPSLAVDPAPPAERSAERSADA